MANCQRIQKSLFSVKRGIDLVPTRCVSHNITVLPKRASDFAKDLDLIERNVLLRKHNNNVPAIRSLVKKLQACNNDATLHNQLQDELRKLPNNTHPRTVAYGDEPLELMQYAAKSEFGEAKDFSEICKRLNLFRMDNLGNYTGHKSYYLKGALATLEQALVQYALQTLKQNGFHLVSVPDILPSTIIEGCGMQTHGERTQVYKINSGLCLSGTSEMALAGLYADEVIEEHDLPIKVAAVSRCYRAETSGLHEEKGIYRVHQFTKVEMFSLCSEGHSEAMLETFKDVEVALFKKLELNFRLLDMPPSELGAPAYQKYDIEAWMPGRQMWGEISSCSNCTDYQSKRLNIRYRTKDNQLKYVHTVNGTACAIPRLLIALIETNQTSEHTIAIPTVLKGLMNMHEIVKNKRIPEVKLIKSIKPPVS